MTNYKFTELTDEEYMEYVEKSNQKHFMQTIYMRDYYNLKGKENYLVGIKDNEEVVACALIYLESIFKGYKKFAIYKGFLCDYDNKELVNFFTKELTSFLKNKKAYMFTIDPNIIEVERDTDANIIEGGLNNYSVIENLKKCGYKKSEKDIQIKWMYVLNLEGKTIDEIFKNFKQNTRNIINRTVSKFKLRIKTVEYDDLSSFKEITNNTSDRRGFIDKSLEYYQNMKKSFKDNVTFKIAELDCDLYLADLYKEKDDYEQKIAKIAGENKKKDNYILELGYINKKIEEIEKLKEEKGNNIPLSCAMFILYGDEVIYFSSGSYSEYMQFYGQYILQWEMIKYAKENGYKRYNFYGIMDVFNKNGKDYGVYEFKKGFSGNVYESLGEYEYIINKNVCTLEKIKKCIKKLLSK